jgi:hypothetical protein
MKFDIFRKLFQGYPLISWPLIKMLTPGNQQLKIQLCRWRKTGKLVRLNRRLFMLNEADRKINPSRLYLAGEMYKPSYLSLEYALSFHGLIPEKVVDLSSVTTKKTMTFKNSFGTFFYRHLKTECFTGFTEEKDEAGLGYFIAGPEKALVDFVYLNLEKFRPGPAGGYGEVLRGSYRLQNQKILDGKKLEGYAALFNSRKLLKVIGEVRP